MKTPLQTIELVSIYKNKLGDLLPLPARMAKCTPDTSAAIFNIAKDLAKQGGKLILSDLYRSYDMQAQAHYDYVSGKKKAFSPAPGGSFHEAGRAFDLSLGALNISLANFWKIAENHGVYPIISVPKTTKSEAWHFECRGSHQLVLQYYLDKKGTNYTPNHAAAISAILAIGVNVDDFGDHQHEALLQSYLIRLGKNIGNIDGYVGRKTQQAIKTLGIELDLNKMDNMLMDIENLIQQKFPKEFS